MTIAAPLTVCAAFERVARIYPDYEAAVDSVSRLTFAALDDASRRCATLLRAQGVVPGSRVGLLTVPSTVHLVAWLGIVRLGAIPVVLHTRESAALQARLYEKFDLSLLLHDASLGPVVAAMREESVHPVRSVALRSATPSSGPASPVEIPRDLAAHEPARDLWAPGEDDVAMIILSSGTTSLPKGVVHSHRNAVEAARSTLSLYAGLRPGQRILVPYSTAFTAAYATWLPFLVSGACTVFLEHFDLGRYLETVRHERITHMSLTPTMWRKLLTLDSDPATYESVVLAQFAAESMDRSTLTRIRDTVCRTVVQAYGSTETFGMVTVHVADDMTGERLGSIGRPFPDTEVRIVREGGAAHEVLPPGAVGEVMATSPSVALGIWEDPENTAKLFHVDAEGRRWWRSGDLARLDADGFLYFEGRSDDMIISGGINIAPAAVEEVLMSHPAVIDAAVVGVPHPQWGQQVHAFVVVADATPTAEDLERYMAASPLSGYQRPRVFHFVQALPRTATNKLNRRALRENGVSVTPVGSG
ncbi:acyl--CoA ligase [Pseudonocardia sp. RS11V-5]|uniref:class I adenylate-forming enzyme family protein n=1 Tax=Pseudonocardia terrae TaxID=2905831 RepID=UPI001E530B80|nr:class I adenylate-forming enzyme family protein [Pseudonocardia terrae]MCE3555812.1 acyl--CoA ligase [Pseudonocardia terrae]